MADFQSLIFVSTGCFPQKPLYFEDIDEAAKCVADIVSHPIEPSVEAIDQALDDYHEVHEDDDTWYSFHEYIEDREG